MHSSTMPTYVWLLLLCPTKELLIYFHNAQSFPASLSMEMGAHRWTACQSHKMDLWWRVDGVIDVHYFWWFIDVGCATFSAVAEASIERTNHVYVELFFSQKILFLNEHLLELEILSFIDSKRFLLDITSILVFWLQHSINIRSFRGLSIHPYTLKGNPNRQLQ